MLIVGPYLLTIFLDVYRAPGDWQSPGLKSIESEKYLGVNT